jgi:hypothetical protein
MAMIFLTISLNRFNKTSLLYSKYSKKQAEDKGGIPRDKRSSLGIGSLEAEIYSTVSGTPAEICGTIATRGRSAACVPVTVSAEASPHLLLARRGIPVKKLAEDVSNRGAVAVIIRDSAALNEHASELN